VTGLLKTLAENKVVKHFRNLHLIEKIFLQGFIITVLLVVIQQQLEGARSYYMSYMPPIGLVFWIALMYLIQPLILGVLNILIINVLYKTRGWQVGFWLNGIFLLLTFSTANLVLQTMWNLPFLPQTAVIDLVALSIPFGFLARFSNGGWKKPID
jgi:hypothetical protein